LLEGFNEFWPNPIKARARQKEKRLLLKMLLIISFQSHLIT